MKHLLITGSSYGLGYAIAKKFSNKKFNLHLISRTMEGVKLDFLKNNTNTFHYSFDLNELNDISTLIRKIFLNIKDIDEIILINNAGILAPISFASDFEPKDIIKHMNINTIAPMIISSEFIKLLKNYNYRKASIISISSGAAKNPYPAWAMYCSSKSALKMFTKVMALEEKYQNNNIKFASFAPGVVATNMQEEIRKQNESNFPLIEKFKNLYKNKLLLDPDFVAEFFYNKFVLSNFENGEFVDIRTVNK